MRLHQLARRPRLEDATELGADLSGAAARDEPYHLALLDHLMPGMDGETLSQHIKHDPAIAETTLIMLTSGAQRGDAQRLLGAGFAAYLVKPIVRPAQLLDAIQRAVLHLRPPHRAGLASAAPSTPAPDAPAPPRSPPATRRVLVAEDNAVNQKLAVRMLQKLGCTVDVAGDGREAIEMYQRFPYDCIFMDCQMPVMDGFEATAAIRSLQAGQRRIPIVAVTANAMVGDREKCMAAGMDDYLAKPLQLEALKRVLENWSPPR